MFAGSIMESWTTSADWDYWGLLKPKSRSGHVWSPGIMYIQMDIHCANAWWCCIWLQHNAKHVRPVHCFHSVHGLDSDTVTAIKVCRFNSRHASECIHKHHLDKANKTHIFHNFHAHNLTCLSMYIETIRKLSKQLYACLKYRCNQQRDHMTLQREEDSRKDSFKMGPSNWDALRWPNLFLAYSAMLKHRDFMWFYVVLAVDIPPQCSLSLSRARFVSEGRYILIHPGTTCINACTVHWHGQKCLLDRWL